MALPEQRLTKELKAATRKPVCLHAATLPILNEMAASGADVLEIDHKTTAGRAKSMTRALGQPRPVGVLAQGRCWSRASHAKGAQHRRRLRTPPFRFEFRLHAGDGDAL